MTTDATMLVMGSPNSSSAIDVSCCDSSFFCFSFSSFSLVGVAHPRSRTRMHIRRRTHHNQNRSSPDDFYSVLKVAVRYAHLGLSLLSVLVHMKAMVRGQGEALVWGFLCRLA